MGVSVSFPTPTPTFPASSMPLPSKQMDDSNDINDETLEIVRQALVSTDPDYDDKQRCVPYFNNYMRCANSIVSGSVARSGKDHCDLKHYENLFLNCSVIAALTQPHAITPTQTVATSKSN
jgi:hypothetical protein